MEYYGTMHLDMSYANFLFNSKLLYYGRMKQIWVSNTEEVVIYIPVHMSVPFHLARIWKKNGRYVRCNMSILLFLSRSICLLGYCRIFGSVVFFWVLIFVRSQWLSTGSFCPSGPSSGTSTCTSHAFSIICHKSTLSLDACVFCCVPYAKSSPPYSRLHQSVKPSS